MDAAARVRRFGTVDRLTHLGLILTFFTLAVTGAAQTLMDTDWGRQALWLMGGYQQVKTIHITAGWVLTVGFGLHILLALARVDWMHPGRSLLGPDSLIPVWRDGKQFFQRFLWFLGLAEAPKFERWTYLEKFDYWAVFWGIPLLFITGLMLYYPVESSRLMPGWTLNVAAVLHRAEAVLAVVYIVLIHLVFGHFRRSTFPLNDAMFSGSVPLDHLQQEKPDWVARLRRQGQLARLAVAAPALWFRGLYFLFAYSIIAFALYLLVAAWPYAAYFHP